MLKPRRVYSPAALAACGKPLAATLASALLLCSGAYAASFGHSRMVSPVGEPLKIDVPVTQLSADDLRSITVSAAPASAWVQAGLEPPVALDTLSTRLVDGFAPGSKIIQVRSTQGFDKPVADLLLDIRTATGQQRYQVSLLTQSGQGNVQSGVSGATAAGQAPGTSAANVVAPGGGQARQGAILVKRGDNMFRISRRHAVPGVTVYQMMIALQRANPQAFIHENVNLVKAGSTLTMPDMAALTAISDREARQVFLRQAQAFAEYRHRAAGGTSTIAQASASSGLVSSAEGVGPEPAPPGPKDQLRLSGSQPAGGGSGAASARANGHATGQSSSAADADARSDDRLATRKGIQESGERVSQLEENVKHLNEALQSQGEAAKDLIVDSAKGLRQSLSDVANAVGSTNPASPNTADSPTNAGNDANAGKEPNAGSGANTGSAASAAATDKPRDGTVGGNAAAGSAANGNAAGDATGNSPSNPQAAAPGANPAANVAQPVLTKAEQTVSWIQEHMLAVITSLLALVVLIIAWILRRANVSHDEESGASSRVITEAMVKEKLDKINLDFDQSSPDDAPARRS
ncbi:MAG TPA: FimV/HubP family polar landmark protein [Candidimonas sp.]|nr:FimV/HubP family polar landmark protein [Candidimonas sp.]